jgi:hypothetical protein
MTCFLVLGPGRSGTSFIAKTLHENGVVMGERFRPPDKKNPDGYYEDLDFKELNESLLANKLPFSGWQYQVCELVDSKSGDWGVKDPRLCYLLGYYLDIIPSACALRAHRPIHEVALSMNRCYGWPIAEALSEAARREALLDRYPTDRVNLDREEIVAYAKAHKSHVAV